MSTTDQTDLNRELKESDGKKYPYPWIFYFALGFMGATVAIMLTRLAS